MQSFRIDCQLDPSDVDVALIDHGLHTYNQRKYGLLKRYAGVASALR